MSHKKAKAVRKEFRKIIRMNEPGLDRKSLKNRVQLSMKLFKTQSQKAKDLRLEKIEIEEQLKSQSSLLQQAEPGFES